MGTYDVEIRDLRGHILFTRMGIHAADEVGARDHIRKIWGPRRHADCVMTTYRRRRARGRVLVGTDFLSGSGDGGGDDGAAGVREPRRPLPGPGHLYAEAPLPDAR